METVLSQLMDNRGRPSLDSSRDRVVLVCVGNVGDSWMAGWFFLFLASTWQAWQNLSPYAGPIRRRKGVPYETSATIPFPGSLEYPPAGNLVGNSPYL